MNRSTFFRLAAMATALVATPAAFAQAPVTTNATFTSTVLPAGPRTTNGATNTQFFNVEGANNNAFASFGVADFRFTTPGTPLTGNISLSLGLTESNAGFTRPGTLNFFLTTDNTTSTMTPPTGQPQPIVYQTGDTPPGVGTQLSQGNNILYSLGSGSFNTTGNMNTGQLDAFTLMPTAAAQDYLIQQYNNGGQIRIVVTEDASSPTLAATFFGSTGTTPPTLTLTPVPEPTTVLAAGALGLAAVGAARRRLFGRV